MRHSRYTSRLLDQRPTALALFEQVQQPRIELRAAASGTEILLYDEIGYWGVTAKDFTRTLAEAGAGPITLRINSPGGDVFDGLAIYNAVRSRGGVSVVIDGLAASMASIIMLAGNTTAIQESAMVMIHRAWGFTIGNAVDHAAQAAVLEKIDGQMAGIYAAKTGKPEDQMIAAMSAETWLNSTEARDMGLIDTVLAPPKVDSAAAAHALAQAKAEADRVKRMQMRLRLAAAA
jgi:ATP-dependent Clp protease protease subunit